MAQVSRKRARRKSSNSDTDDLPIIARRHVTREKDLDFDSRHQESSNSTAGYIPRLEPDAENDADRPYPGNSRQKGDLGHDYHSTHAYGNAFIHQGDSHYYGPTETISLWSKLSASLDFPQRHSRYDDVEDKYSETFEWVLRPPSDQQPVWDSFSEWLYSAKNIYWVSGKPGSGKSTLMKHLFTTIKNDSVHDNTDRVFLSFWFWEAAHEELERTLKGCLRSILWQALQNPKVRSDIANAIQHYAGYEWTRSSLLKAFDIASSVLRSKGVTILILLDGLDESGFDRELLVDFVINTSKSSPNVKFCVSSRHESLFEARLAMYPKLRMQDLNGPDIDVMIKQDLLESPEYIDLCRSDRQVDELGIRDILREKAHGVVLWVLLVIRDLLRGLRNWDTAQQLEDRIDIMPAELDKLYDMMLKRNEKDSRNYRKDAAFYCQLIAHRKFDLISFSLAINDDVRRAYLNIQNDWSNMHHRLQCERAKVWVNARTGGLLEVRSFRVPPGPLLRSRSKALTSFLNHYSGKHIDFIHRTARTYLFDSSPGRELLASSTKTTAEIECLCLEASIVRGTVLIALESAAPVGLEIITRNVFFRSQGTECDCNPKTTIARTNGVIIETAMNALQREQLLWTEMHPTVAFDEDPRIDVSFVALPASAGRNALDYCRLYAYLEVWPLFWHHFDSQRALNEGNMTALMPWISQLLLLGLFKQEEEESLWRGCKMDPDYVAHTEFSEEVSLFHEVIWSLSGPLQRPFSHKRDEMFLNVPVVKWLHRAKISTIQRIITPTMRACNSLFFMEKNRSDWSLQYSVFGTHSLQYLEPFLRFKFGITPDSHIHNNLTRNQAHSVPDCTVIVEWQSFGPRIYGLEKHDSLRFLHEVSKFLKKQDEAPLSYQPPLEYRPLLEYPSTVEYRHQAIHFGYHGTVLPYGRTESTVSLFFDQFKRTLLPSLYAALRHMNKSQQSILAFAGDEGKRLKLQLSNADFRRWEAWFWGSETSRRQSTRYG